MTSAKHGYMLEHLSILVYSPQGSENDSGADNQQGSPSDPSETTRRAPLQWVMI